MPSIILPKRNRVQVVHNDMTQCWEVQRAGIILYSGQLGGCEFFCSNRGLTITNLDAIEGVRATARSLVMGATA